MEEDFWHQRWARGEIGFHQAAPNAVLIRHFPSLALPPRSRIFVPLCGKTHDIGWFLAQGHRVVGAEFSAFAIDTLFADLGVTPDIRDAGALRLYQAQDVEIYVGDIFDLTPATLGPLDAVYDRAALVALPPDMRPRYVAHLLTLGGAAPHLLDTFEYDQTTMRGPPFSVDAAEVALHYAATCALTLLDRVPVAGGLRGRPAQDALWRVQPHLP